MRGRWVDAFDPAAELIFLVFCPIEAALGDVQDPPVLAAGLIKPCLVSGLDNRVGAALRGHPCSPAERQSRQQGVEEEPPTPFEVGGVSVMHIASV